MGRLLGEIFLCQLCNQLRYRESCGYGEEMYPEANEGRLSVQMNPTPANPDIGGSNIGGDYLIVSKRTI